MKSIKTDRLLLLPATTRPDTIEKVVNWLNDPAVVRYSEQRHHAHTPESQRAYVLEMLYPNKYMEIWHDNELVGTVSAHIDEHNQVANLGILIGKEHWRKGYGLEAWEGFSNYLLKNGIRKIEAGAMEFNTGMIKIFEKSGMQPEAALLNHFLLNGRAIDMLQYARYTR